MAGDLVSDRRLSIDLSVGKGCRGVVDQSPHPAGSILDGGRRGNGPGEVTSGGATSRGSRLFDLRHAGPLHVPLRPVAGPGGRTREAFEEKVELIRLAAGDRFDEIEVGTLLINVTITDDADQALDELLAGFASTAGNDDGDRGRLTREDLVASPVVVVGPLEQVCDELLGLRETLGFTYFASPVGARPQLLGPVIERLSLIS
jgi:hypothetical protein